MEPHSSSVDETHVIQFDKKLLGHFEQKENIQARAILQKNPGLSKLVDNDGCTLLHYAAKYVNVYMATYLYDLNVDVNFQDRRGRTAIMTVPSHPEAGTLINFLLLYSSYLHLRDVNGESALQTILKKDLPKMRIENLCARNLIATYSSDCDKLAELYLECENPLGHLIRSEYPMLTRSILRQGYPVNSIVCTETGQTALHVAVYNRDVDHVKALIDFGADVNATDKDGAPPLALFSVSHKGSREMLEILRILLDRGALTTKMIDPIVPDSFLTPGSSVLRFGGRREIRLLLEYDLDLHAKDAFDRTPLHFLANNRSENVLEELQGMDFDVNARDDQMRSPLHYAVGNSSSVSFLLKNGADVNALDERGQTPLSLAFWRDKDYEEPFIGRASFVRCIELLLESGADPQTVSSDGITIVQSVDHKEFTAIKPVLAHLVLLKVRGVDIKKHIEKQIKRHYRLRDSFNFYVKKLIGMNEIEVWESLTLYDLLMKDEKKLATSMRNRDLVLRLARLRKKYIPKSNYYLDLMRRRVQKILRKTQLKSRAAVVISNLMNLDAEASYIITDAIVNYLDSKDLLNLLQL